MDVVLSDMCHSTHGNSTLDAAKSLELAEVAWRLAVGPPPPPPAMLQGPLPPWATAEQGEEGCAAEEQGEEGCGNAGQREEDCEAGGEREGECAAQEQEQEGCAAAEQGGGELCSVRAGGVSEDVQLKSKVRRMWECGTKGGRLRGWFQGVSQLPSSLESVVW